VDSKTPIIAGAFLFNYFESLEMCSDSEMPYCVDRRRLGDEWEYHVKIGGWKFFCFHTATHYTLAVKDLNYHSLLDMLHLLAMSGIPMHLQHAFNVLERRIQSKMDLLAKCDLHALSEDHGKL